PGDYFYRLIAVLDALFRLIDEVEENPGFPRGHRRHNFFTLCYPAMYLKVVGKTLLLPTGGKGKNKRYPNVVATLTETPPGGFREVAVSRDARGCYYASFVYREIEEEAQEGQVVAFDLGIK